MSSAPYTGLLTVDAGNPAVRIEVLDHAYRVQARAYGRLHKEFPTGLYTVRYAAADASEETDVAIRPGADVMLDDPPDLFVSSPAPLALTRTSHEYHQAAAEALSRGPAAPLGGGSQLFLFIRDVQPGLRSNLAADIELCDAAGTRISAVAEIAQQNPATGEAPWAGCTMELDPGFYRLRLNTPGYTPLDLPLHLVQGWQSQLFVLRQGGHARLGKRAVPDLPGATQFMVPAGMGFEANSRVKRRMQPEEAGEDLRLADLARQALAAGRADIARDDLRAMLNGKWLDPLLGVYGVHLLLMRADADLDLAGLIQGRIQGIVGGVRHPDLDALALEIGRRIGQPQELPPFEHPPMLRRSWAALIAESAHQPHLIPSGSLCDRIVDRLWGDGAFLVFVRPQDRHRQPAAEEPGEHFPEAGSAADQIEIIRHADHIEIGGVFLPIKGAVPEPAGGAEQALDFLESSAPRARLPDPPAGTGPLPPCRGLLHVHRCLPFS